MTTEIAKNRLAYGLLAILIVLHIGLAVTYAVITPYRTPGYLAVFRSVPYQRNPLTGKVELVWQHNQDIGAPDEIAHSNFAIDVLGGNGLPVVKTEVPDPQRPGQLMRNPALGAHYEDHHGPLYYVLTAGFGKLIGLDANTAADPDRGYTLRFLNAIFGGLTVAGVYFLAVWGIGRKDIGILAAAITALLPMNLALSGAMSNDPLLFTICTWSLAFCALGVVRGWTTKIALMLGVLLGLGLLTKTTALTLIPLIGLAFYIRKPQVGQAIGTWVVGIGLAMPWFVRNQMLYGDPLELKVFRKLFADEITTSQFISQTSGTALNHWFNYVGWFTARSFFGVFGYMDIFLNERGVAYTGPANSYGPAAPNTLYRLLIALTALAAMGFLLYLAQPKSRTERQIHLLNGVFLALITLSFVMYNLTFFQGQARYFYPGIGPISIGLAIGALYFAKSRKKLTIGSILALLLVLNAYALYRLPSEFAKRINPTLANQATRLDHPTIDGSLSAVRLDRAAGRLE